MRTSKTFKILFWQNTAKTNSHYVPIYARITVNGKRAEISIGNSYPVALWNAKISRTLGRTLEIKGTISVNKL